MGRFWRVVVVVVAAMVWTGTMAVNAASNQAEKTTGVVTPTPEVEKAEREKRLAEATDAAKQLLLALDTKKTGKVSKEEWMKFMEAEFDRLDTDHLGTAGRQRVDPITSAGPSFCRQVTTKEPGLAREGGS